MTPHSAPKNALQALEYVQDGNVVGLGTGRAATAFLHALAERARAGLRVRGVPTSEATARLARQLGIPLTDLGEAMPIDVTVDGADEVDPDLNLIKGLGGALVREKIVAAASRRLVILLGPDNVKDKVSNILGKRGVLPVEVVPFGLPLVQRRLLDLGWPSTPRAGDGCLFVTDNGNHILDLQIGRLPRPEHTDWQLRTVPGIVDTGLFIGMADAVLIQDGDALQVRQRPRP
jgi:ribose 5-phosphate isomerase A